jgi:sugar phosphate isomerase/epimerase
MNRREFLTATAVASLAGGCIHPVSSHWRLWLSTSSIHFKHLPLERACERIAALGFDGVDIWSGYEGCPHLDDASNRLGPGGLKDLLDRLRLRLCSFSTYVGGYAKYAALLGGAGGGVAIQGSAGPCPPAELTSRMKAFFESLKPLADLAAQHNSWLAIENHGDALLDSLDSFRAFVDLNPFDRVDIALAPYHLQARGDRVEDAIRIAGRRLLFFYAWQKADGLAQLPGHGPADFKPWLRALRDIGYRRFVNPFMHGDVESGQMAAALAQSRTYLKALA